MVLGILAAAMSSVSNDKNQDILYQASHALNDVARKAMPAVVSITSIRDMDSYSTSNTTFPNDASEQATLGIGSGVIIKPDGLILTNLHVIQNAQSVSVSIDDKHKAVAHVIGGDSKTDLALIQLDHYPRKDLPTLSFGDSDRIQVGDWSIAIGSPFGLNRSVTSGIVSAVGRGRLGMLDIEDFIQTDAAINPGSSGGPLLNMNGQMIGINTAIFSQSGGFIGIGFAIPSKIAKQVTDDLLKHGRVIRGWAGMSAQDLDVDLAHFFQTPSAQGALVSQITPRGPASNASLKTGDVITKFGDVTIESADHLKSLVGKAKALSHVKLEIYRDGVPLESELIVREQPDLKPVKKTSQLAGQAASNKILNTPAALGITVQDIPPEFSILLGLKDLTGAFVTGVKMGSPAFYAGISTGDIILGANKTEIRNAKELIHALKRTQQTDMAVLYVQRGPDEKVYIPVKTNLS